MKTLEIKLPDEIFGALGRFAKQKDEFVVEAIKEKIERENKNLLLVEDYQANAKEEFFLSKEFKIDKSNTLRAFGLSKNEFVVPDDFDAPLPESVLADFEN